MENYLEIQVLGSKTIIGVEPLSKIYSIKEEIELKTGIPVENQILINEEGIIEQDRFTASSKLYLAVMGDVPSEAERWFKENDISLIKVFWLKENDILTETFKLRFLTKIDYLNITEYDTIYKVKSFIEKQYQIRRNDQMLLFKGEEVSENLFESVFNLIMNDKRDRLTYDFGLDLVVVKKPFTLRVKHVHEREIEREYNIVIQDADTIGEVKQKITEQTSFTINVQLFRDDKGTKRLDDETSRTVADLDLGLYPILWMMSVVRIHLKLPGHSRFSYYEAITRETTLQSILFKIQMTHSLKRNWLIDVHDKQGRRWDLDLFSSTGADEMFITVYATMEPSSQGSSCHVM